MSLFCSGVSVEIFTCIISLRPQIPEDMVSFPDISVLIHFIGTLITGCGDFHWS